jgi:hypothetical protein
MTDVGAASLPPSGALGDQDWYRWHAPYDELVSDQSERLGAVQDVLGSVMDAAPAGSLRAVSICSGQSRDLLPMLIRHPRGRDFRVRMIELDPLNASFLHGALGSTDLTEVEVLVADAGLTDSYAGAVPADLVLVSGPFAHLDEPDLRRTIAALDQFCAAGAGVVWSSYGPGLAHVDLVLSAFNEAGFTSMSLERDQAGEFVVGSHRFQGRPAELVPGRRLFTFGSGSGDSQA